MRVVDTSAWIEWLLGSGVGRAVDSELPTSSEWIVPTIVQYELAKWASREASPGRSRNDVLAFSNTCTVVDLTSQMAIRAATLSRQHGLATADSIIYATAVEKEAMLLTCDAHFRDLPGVIYIENKPH